LKLTTQSVFVEGLQAVYSRLVGLQQKTL